MTDKLTLPSVHINGTSQEELLRQIGEAMTAGREFLTKLEDAAPNARDYYVQGPDAFGKAQKEFQARYDVVKNCVRELMAIAEHLVGV